MHVEATFNIQKLEIVRSCPVYTQRPKRCHFGPLCVTLYKHKHPCQMECFNAFQNEYGAYILLDIKIMFLLVG